MTDPFVWLLRETKGVIIIISTSSGNVRQWIIGEFNAATVGRVAVFFANQAHTPYCIRQVTITSGALRLALALLVPAVNQ
jgi:hypothetical protein